MDGKDRLRQYRREIDELDRTIARAIAERLKVSLKIAKIKDELEIPTEDNCR